MPREGYIESCSDHECFARRAESAQFKVLPKMMDDAAASSTAALSAANAAGTTTVAVTAVSGGAMHDAVDGSSLS